MIGKSCYIRAFTPLQKKQLEAIAVANGLKTAVDVLLHALDNHQELQSQNERLTRFNARKTDKIESLNIEIERLKNLNI